MRLQLVAVSVALHCSALSDLAMADETSPYGEDSIIVTGEKAERTLQETTTSVSVITSEKLKDENILSTLDIFQRTANVVETRGSAGFSIRGIDQRGVSGGGDSATATIFVDGVPVFQNILSHAPTDVWDIAQIEIFRGPQSTLQGVNSLAGAMHIRTNDPTFDWSAKTRILLSSFDTRHFAMAGGGPLVPDELAFRVSAEKRDSDGYIHNVTRNAPENPVDSATLRAKLLWAPSAWAGFEAKLGYQHFESKGQYQFPYTDRSVPDYHDNRTFSADYPNHVDMNTDQATLDLSYALGAGLSINALSTYSDTSFYRQFDGDFSPASFAYSEGTGGQENFTQELRLNYEGGRLSGLVGLFYSHKKRTERSDQASFSPTPTNTIAALLQSAAGFDAATASAIANLYTSVLPLVPVDYDTDFSTRTETTAIFADARFRLTERLSLLGGFRYERERNKVDNEAIAQFAGTLPDPAAFGPLAPAIAGINGGILALVQDASGSAPPGSRTFEAFLPKAGMEMAWTPDLSTAFIAQRGYRSGGDSFNIARSQLFAYDPEYIWNYELSLRSIWLDGQLTANANAFYVDWTRQQTQANFGNGPFDEHTVNAGKSHLYGFEVELAHSLSPALDWYASIGHVRTKFDEFTVDQGSITDLSGLQFAYAPRWTLSAGANLRFGGGFNANVNASYRSAVYTETTPPQSSYRVGERTLVNARIGYEAEHWNLSLFARNIFDEEYDQYVYNDFNTAIIGAPPSVGVIFEAGF